MQRKGIRFGALFIALVVLAVYPIFFAQSFGLFAGSITGNTHFDAEQVGIVSAAFLFASGLVQIPAGIASDRLRPGRFLAISALVCACGAALVGVSQSLEIATLGRIFMGLGAAIIGLTSLKVLTLISSVEHCPVATGALQLLYRVMVSILVALVVQLDMETSWRSLMFLLAGVGVALSVIAWMTDSLIPKPRERYKSSVSVWSSLRTVIGNRDVLMAAVFFGLTVGPLLTYA